MANISESAFGDYLQVFHDTLIESAGRFLPARLRGNLHHMARLPCRVRGTVSTQFGVSIDYDPFAPGAALPNSTYSVTSTSQRIEEAIFRQYGATLSFLERRPLAIGGRYWMAGIHFLQPVTLDKDSALILDRCAFSEKEAAPHGWFMETALLELYSVNDSTHWTSELAIARSKDEVLSALYELERSRALGVSLADYYSRHRPKSVLCLGSYSKSGLHELHKVSDSLAALGYEPVLLSDIPNREAQTLDQKVVMAGSLSSFVVLVDSEKAGQLNELELCKINGWITVVMQPGGVPSSGMSAAPGVLSTVIREQPYSVDRVTPSLREAMAWAETTRRQIGSKLIDAYPWLKRE